MIDTGTRPAGDILSRTVRITLAGREYPLQVLYIAGNERWNELERRITSDFVDDLAGMGRDMGEILARFRTQVELQLDLLYAYDTDGGRRAGVLPDRAEIRERIYEDELEAALREVVKAANPKAVTSIEQMRGIPTSGSSTPTSTSPPPTASPRKRSGKH